MIVEDATIQLKETCESLLNQHGFSLYVQDERYSDNYTLLEYISFLHTILESAERVVSFNDILESLRKNIITEVLSKDEYKAYITCDVSNGSIKFKQTSRLAYNTVCNGILDHLVGVENIRPIKV